MPALQLPLFVSVPCVTRSDARAPFMSGTHRDTAHNQLSKPSPSAIQPFFDPSSWRVSSGPPLFTRRVLYLRAMPLNYGRGTPASKL